MSEGIHIKSDAKYGKDFSFYKRTIPAGKHYSLHWHDFLEFEIVVSGEGQHIYNGKSYIVSSGSAYLMCYYDFHSLTALSDMTIYNIHFNENLLDGDLLNYLNFKGVCCDFSNADTLDIVKKLDRLLEEETKRLSFNNIIIKNIIADIVIEMIRKVNPTKPHPNPLPVQKALAYINTNFRNPITLDMLSADLSFSPNYLGHIFKSQTGYSFNEYINTVRLKYACNLLLVSDLSIKEIAFASGYNSVQYFLCIFKKKMHITPGDYRQQGTKSTPY